MTTEVRDYGDNRTIVVFTTDNQVSQKMVNRSKLINTIEYSLDTGKGIRCIGKDFYFPKRQLLSILRALGISKQKNFKLAKFAEIKI